MAKLNERTLIVMFSEVGPVNELMEFRAREAVSIARDNVRNYMQNYRGSIEAVAEAVDYEVIQVGPGEIEILIGVRDDGKIAHSIVQKEEQEQVILEPAIQQVFG